jgi:hypothetical protein
MSDDDDDDDDIINEVKCFDCKKIIEGKPWITLSCDKGEFFIHGCSYSCSRYLGKHMGGSYWDKVENKEDFDMPRPVTYWRVKKDITNENIQETQLEIEEEEEEKRIQMIEDNYNESSDGFISDDY